MKFFLWQAGVIGFAAAIWRFGYWREIVPLAVLAAAFVWIVGGGLWVSQRRKGQSDAARISPADRAVLQNLIMKQAQDERDRENARVTAEDLAHGIGAANPPARRNRE